MVRWVLLLALVVSLAGADPLDDCLAQVGLDRQTARIDLRDMSNFGGGEFRLPLFDVLIEDPYKIPHYMATFRRRAAEQRTSLHGLVSSGTSRVGETIRRGWLEDPHEKIAPAAKEAGALAAAIAKVHERAGQELSTDQRAGLDKAAGEVAAGVAEQAAFLVLATLDALEWREKALRELPGDLDLGDLERKLLAEDDGGGYDRDMWRLMRGIDLRFLFSGAEDLALAVDKAVKALQEREGPAGGRFEQDTPLGRIVIDGEGDDAYADGPYLLTIDLAGNDTYAAAAATSVDRPASIAIDLAGDDVYDGGADGGPAFGAGVFGYAFLVDAAGQDQYRARTCSQGVGLFGVGALLDLEGDDTYDCHSFGQGAGHFGLGILSDAAGQDRYDCMIYSQGYGYVKGYGLLLDAEGDDTYTADDTNIENPSPQTKEHNSSLSQGCGFGRRADYTDGHSLAGGVGMLVDLAGNDVYSAGLFAQGAGYWYGLGCLLDEQGDDRYSAVWYDQAASAHFAIGILVDSAGDDHYKASHNMALGAGHDFSVGYFLEEGGNDTYEAPNLSLGGGNANGIGIFHDVAGDDTYQASAAMTLGRANTAAKRGHLRDAMLSLGVFLDTGGADTYPEKYDFAGNNKAWTQAGTNTKEPVEIEKGCGLDCEGR